MKASHLTGRGRAAFILDRATRRFPSDIGLWMLQIGHARRQKAHKKLSQIFTKVLRLHPTKPELWTFAAQFAMEEHGDMTEARSYMQRGLRFCKRSKVLWIEYMKLELLYIAKITARWQILGIEQKPDGKDPTQVMGERASGDADLTRLTSEDNPVQHCAHRHENNASLSRVVKPSVLDGAIPIVIFDAAMAQFGDDEELAQTLFDVVDDFDHIPCLGTILAHAVDHMLKLPSWSWRTSACSVKLACAGTSITSPEFPKSLGNALNKIQEASSEVRESKEFVKNMQRWFDSFLDKEDLDVALRRIILSTLNQLRTAADWGSQK